MIVIVLVGILSAIAAPNYMTYMAERRLNGAARMVMSDLMAARSKAVTLNQRVKVSFGSTHAYEIWNDADTNETVADSEGDDIVRDIHPDYYDVTFSATADPVLPSQGHGLGDNSDIDQCQDRRLGSRDCSTDRSCEDLVIHAAYETGALE